MVEQQVLDVRAGRLAPGEGRMQRFVWRGLQRADMRADPVSQLLRWRREPLEGNVAFQPLLRPPSAGLTLKQIEGQAARLDRVTVRRRAVHAPRLRCRGREFARGSSHPAARDLPANVLERPSIEITNANSAHLDVEAGTRPATRTLAFAPDHKRPRHRRLHALGRRITA
ncbi:MAG: hypothetical protein ACLP01_11095 [Solirubrobacteraceae bacterium]